MFTALSSLTHVTSKWATPCKTQITDMCVTLSGIDYISTCLYPIKICIWFSWWRHQMETLYSLLAFCAGNSPATGEFPAQRPVARNFDDFFDLRPHKWLSKQWRRWWFVTASRSLWRYYNVVVLFLLRLYYQYLKKCLVQMPIFCRVASLVMEQF